MRCMRPGVPGIAHGRARVLGSRRYGQKSPSWLGASANGTPMSARASTSGNRHGSGAGGGVAQWMAYAHAVQSAKDAADRNRFGAGDVRGVLSERGSALDLTQIRTTLGLLEDALGQSDLMPVFDDELGRWQRSDQ